jgi:LmbE family N-acetylglucosaminyl deacetylase
MRALRLLLPASVLLATAALTAQLRVQPVGEHPGELSLRLMLRKLNVAGTFMQTDAHPDDEDNGLLAMMGHGRGLRTVLVTATRGDGGQNEIGPELFDALGMLRTQELMSVHRFDGAEQYFTRAIDFGYSFSVEESLQRWGHQEILSDFVRHIRTLRPDVIAGFLCGGTGGGQHHQASTELTREAFRAAADPSRFPEQLSEGLRPWAAKRLFCTDLSSFSNPPADSARLVSIRDSFDPLLGRRYSELGIEARSMHKCQGTSQLLPLPGQSFTRRYRLEDARIGSREVAPADIFDGIDTSLAGLAAFAGSSVPSSLVAALKAISDAVGAAEHAVDAGGQSAAAAPLATGLLAVRRLRSDLEGMPIDETGRFEIDFRLEQKERQFEQALQLASGLRLDVLASDGLVIPKQPVKVSVLAESSEPAAISVDRVSATGFAGSFVSCPTTIRAGAPFKCEADLALADAPLSTAYWHARKDAARYDFEPGVPFGVPFRPSPFRVKLALTIAGAAVSVERTVQYRYDTVVAGEKRMELQVVPPLSVNMEPEIAVIPSTVVSGEAGEGRDAHRQLRVTVLNNKPGAARGTVSLEVPGGWTVSPERTPVTFAREDESVTLTFDVAPPRAARSGEYPIVAVVVDGESSAVSKAGYQSIEYPHVERRQLIGDARTRLKIIDVTMPEVRVGYVMGVGDQVPEAIEQLGADVSLIGPDELASGDLSVYDVIVTGVRAYERRADLRANNHRLLDYAAAGGTVIVQYNKFEFNQAQYGPYPAKVSSNRVTDEDAPVAVLVPDHPVFTTPNRIGPESWQGWVQERGLYFLGDKDSRYTDLVRLSDSFELNPGPKTGALVEAKVGKGRWLYVGLGLWRQLPAGTDGAYRILANLLALGSRR